MGRDELYMDGLRLAHRGKRAERAVRCLFCSGDIRNCKMEIKKGISFFL